VQGVTGVWLKYCGTAGKPGGNRENKPQPVASEETGLLDSIVYAFNVKQKNS